MWSADNGDQPSPLSPHRPIHLCDLIRKRTELVLTQEGLLVYSETYFRVQAHIGIIDTLFFFGWKGKGRDAHRFGDGGQGEHGASLPVQGRTASACWWRCSEEGKGRAFGVGWDVIDSREELSQ